MMMMMMMVGDGDDRRLLLFLDTCKMQFELDSPPLIC